MRHLQSVGAAVVPLSDELPPDTHVRDGLTITFWRHVPALPDVAVTERDLAPALAELHAALATFPGDLPVLAGPISSTGRRRAWTSCKVRTCAASRGPASRVGTGRQRGRRSS